MGFIVLQDYHELGHKSHIFYYEIVWCMPILTSTHYKVIFYLLIVDPSPSVIHLTNLLMDIVQSRRILRCICNGITTLRSLKLV